MQAARYRQQPDVGRGGPEPTAHTWRTLAIHVLVLAARDAVSQNPLEQADALAWLNSDEGRAMARTLGVIWRQPLTPVDLQAVKRNAYFRGG